MAKKVHPEPPERDERWRARVGRAIRAVFLGRGPPSNAPTTPEPDHTRVALIVAASIAVGVLLAGLGLPSGLGWPVILGISVILAAIVFVILYRAHPAVMLRRAFVSTTVAVVLALLGRGFSGYVDLGKILHYWGVVPADTKIVLSFGPTSWLSLGAMLAVLGLLYLGVRAERGDF